MLGKKSSNELFKKIKKQLMSMITLLEVGEKKMKNIVTYTTKKQYAFYKFVTYQKEHPGKATLSMQNKM